MIKFQNSILTFQGSLLENYTLHDFMILFKRSDREEVIYNHLRSIKNIYYSLIETIPLLTTQVIIIPRITLKNELMPPSEAIKILLNSFTKPVHSVQMPVRDASGYILAEPVYSNRTSPPVLLSGPDGIAVKNSDTSDASQDNPVEVDATRVNTGMPMPEGFDAVIMIEEVTEISEHRYRIHTPVTADQNTIPKGSDITKGDLIMDRDHLINPFDVGALLSYGLCEVPVFNVKVGLIATGDEVIPLRKNPLPGQIVDTNSHMIASYMKQVGATPVFGQVVSDDPISIIEEMKKMAEICDIVLIFGGSSAGSKDYTVDAIEQGGKLLFHGVGMAPGKPVSLGSVNGKPVFGMPGPSIGSLIILYEMIYPLLKNWGLPIPSEEYTQGELMQTVETFPGFDLFLMMQVSVQNGKTQVTPVPRIFGHMMGVRANGILKCKNGSEPIQKGSEVKVRLIRYSAT